MISSDRVECIDDYYYYYIIVVVVVIHDKIRLLYAKLLGQVGVPKEYTCKLGYQYNTTSKKSFPFVIYNKKDGYRQRQRNVRQFLQLA